MHELSIVQETVAKILDQAKENGIKKIKEVHLSVGGDLQEDSVEFCFRCLAKGDIFEKYKLKVGRNDGIGIVIERIEGVCAV